MALIQYINDEFTAVGLPLKGINILKEINYTLFTTKNVFVTYTGSSWRS